MSDLGVASKDWLKVAGQPPFAAAMNIIIRQ